MPRLHSLLPLAAAIASASGIASSANTTPDVPGTSFGEPTVNLTAVAEHRSYGSGIMSNNDLCCHAAQLLRRASGPSNTTDLLNTADVRDTHQVYWGGVIRVGR